MPGERSRVATRSGAPTDQPPNTQAETRPLFGTKIRSTLEEVREMRRGDRRAEEPEDRRLFGNRIREARREVVDFRERRRAAKDIAHRE